MKLIATDKHIMRKAGDIFECEDVMASVLIAKGDAIEFHENEKSIEVKKSKTKTK